MRGLHYIPECSLAQDRSSLPSYGCYLIALEGMQARFVECRAQLQEGINPSSLTADCSDLVKSHP